MPVGLRYFHQGPIKISDLQMVGALDGLITNLPLTASARLTPAIVDSFLLPLRTSGFKVEVIESLPVAEVIKYGGAERDHLIEIYAHNIEVLAAAGIKVICYNFMPVYDWVRSGSRELEDGSKALFYDENQLAQMRLLPGWSAEEAELEVLLARYREVNAKQLWANLKYFLDAVIPVAERVGIKLAIHPDDPPWPVFDLPRIISTLDDLKHLLELNQSPSNAITFCLGSLGANPDFDPLAAIAALNSRIAFVHLRNVSINGPHAFTETGHHTGRFKLDEIIAKLVECGYTGWYRPDHGRQIWGEADHLGYGLYDRALAACYIKGVLAGIKWGKKK